MEEKSLRVRFHDVIFYHHTSSGKLFDVVLLLAIGCSLLAVIMESVPWIGATYGELLFNVDLSLNILFTIEYALRIYCSPVRKKYIFSFLGLVDLVSILPGYLGLFYDGAHSLMVIRALRLMRVFRVLKLANFDSEGLVIIRALLASRYKILVFSQFLVIVVVIMGTLMHLVEGPEGGFDSIPRGMYWAIVTLTTVGYGDITPKSFWGQTLSSMVMIMGYAVIAVPTGIVTAELNFERNKSVHKGRKCDICDKQQMDEKADYCSNCGHQHVDSR